MSSIKILLGAREISSHNIDKDTVILGRSPESDIFIPNLAVSRKHGRIFRKNGKWFYEDLCSTNGTYLNSSKVSLVQLNQGIELVIGKYKIIFFESSQVKDAHPAYSIDFKKLLEEDEESSNGWRGKIDESIRFDRTLVIKYNQPRTDGKGKKEIKPIAYIEFADTKEKINISDEIIYIGKAPECKVRINGLLIASRHAKIEYDGENIKLIALKSFPAVYVNGVKVSERILKKDDYIDIGSYRLRIRFF
ncbi:MAG: FHA domain-containing protein [Myxococcota bacterium]